MQSSLELMVKYLVHQQFYSEDEDVIVSRDKQVRVYIPGAKQITSFVDEVASFSVANETSTTTTLSETDTTSGTVDDTTDPPLDPTLITISAVVGCVIIIDLVVAVKLRK